MAFDVMVPLKKVLEELRQAVREALSHNAHVKSFETGGDKEGGEGVTVAKLG